MYICGLIMSTIELKLTNINGASPTILQLTTDDICDLFDKLLSKLSSNKSNVKFTKHTFVPEQFKTNGENKLILIINKEILYLKINLVEDSIKYILVDKISDFKSDKGIWLDINWESKLSFDTMLVNCKNNKVSRNEYDRYQRMILKVRLDKDKMTYIKSFVEPSN